MLVVADDGYQTRILQAELEQRVGDVSTNPAATASASPGVRSTVILEMNSLSSGLLGIHIRIPRSIDFPGDEEGEGQKKDTQSKESECGKSESSKKLAVGCKRCLLCTPTVFRFVKIQLHAERVCSGVSYSRERRLKGSTRSTPAIYTILVYSVYPFHLHSVPTSVIYGIAGAYVSLFYTLSLSVCLSLSYFYHILTYGWTFLSLHLFFPPRLYFYVFSAVLGVARTLPRARPYRSDLFLATTVLYFDFTRPVRPVLSFSTLS